MSTRFVKGAVSVCLVALLTSASVLPAAAQYDQGQQGGYGPPPGQGYGPPPGQAGRSGLASSAAAGLWPAARTGLRTPAVRSVWRTARCHGGRNGTATGTICRAAARL